MAEGVDKIGWDRTAELWALLANLWSGSESPHYRPRMIHPYHPDRIPAAGSDESRIRLTTDNVAVFAEAFVKQYSK